jgi:hypothetical protein
MCEENEMFRSYDGVSESVTCLGFGAWQSARASRCFINI